MECEIVYEGDVAIFNGYKFRKDKKSGYYLSSKKINGKRRRLHRYVWEYFYGEIPEKYQIHHKDGNKDNNHISNLELLSPSNHMSIHMNQRNKKEMREKFLKNMTMKAIEWHKSPEGKEWHKNHFNKITKKLWLKKTEKKCLNCRKVYHTYNYVKSKSKFCSNNCRSQYRRKHKKDYELQTIKCEMCGKVFKEWRNKYGKPKRFCSRSCARKFYWHQKNKEKGKKRVSL